MKQGPLHGKVPQWGSSMLASWEKAGKVRRVYDGRHITGVQILRGAVTATAEPQPASNGKAEPWSMRDKVAAVLQRHADEHGKVRLTIDEIREKARGNRHDVVEEAVRLAQQRAADAPRSAGRQEHEPAGLPPAGCAEAADGTRRQRAGRVGHLPGLLLGAQVPPGGRRRGRVDLPAAAEGRQPALAGAHRCRASGGQRHRTDSPPR